jgi:hypothetical protein
VNAVLQPGQEAKPKRKRGLYYPCCGVIEDRDAAHDCEVMKEARRVLEEKEAARKRFREEESRKLAMMSSEQRKEFIRSCPLAATYRYRVTYVSDSTPVKSTWGHDLP